MIEMTKLVFARLGQLPAGAAFGATLILAAQSILDGSAGLVERGIGWSIIIAASVYAVRLVIRTTERMDARTLETLERYRTDLLDARERIRVLEADLREEQRLRLSLERQGLVNRRHDPLEERE